MRIMLLGKRWVLRFLSLAKYRHEGHRVDGLCDPPDVQNKEILIESRLQGKTMLETLIHEMLHAMCHQLSEEAVTAIAHDLAQVLWRLGYRRENE